VPAYVDVGLVARAPRCVRRLHVSHVCHRWREIALNQPLLWNHVDFTTVSGAGATEMLVRAKSVPLYLKSMVSCYLWRGYQYRRLGKELQAHTPCICHLSVSAKPTLLECTLAELVSPAPTLECLSLSSRGWSQELDANVPNTLFNGHTPRLSCLELRNCGIDWKSPLFKGLEYLEIITPSTRARPNLVVWLDALNEMPRLKKLTLHSASPISPPLPFNVERAVTLPSLTHLDISASVDDCSLALAHLDLPVLTYLCPTVIYDSNSSNVQGVFPYVARHAHGPQDIQPLQSLLVRYRMYDLDILAWPAPYIDVEVHDPPALLGVALPTRVALSFKSMDGRWYEHDDMRPEILDAVMTALPLDGLVMLTAQNLTGADHYLFLTSQFWLRHSPKWPLLRRVRLAPPAVRGFVEMLLEDIGEREKPLLPSLTELVLVRGRFAERWKSSLCDALMKRVEQGVPLQMLDLRAYDYLCSPAELRLLSEIVVDVLGPVYIDRWVPERELDVSGQAMCRMRDLWCDLAKGPFPFLDDDHPDDEHEEDEE
jgi:hypothetical protein